MPDSLTPPSRRTLLTLLPLTLVVWGTFGNTLLNGFVWDDNVLLVDNPVYLRFDTYRIFSSLANGLEYLPVRDLSYAADFLLWGSNPAGFHFSNVVYYWLSVIAVFYLAQATARFLRQTDDNSGKRAFLTGGVTALLYAVHPIHSEAVSFITCRNALLSTLLFFCAGHLYLSFLTDPNDGARRWLRYAGALLCFGASLLAKATGIVLPLILACYIFFPTTRRRTATLATLGPFLCLSIATFFFFTRIAEQTHVISGTRGGFDLGNWPGLAAKAIQIICFYLGKLFAPYGYSIEYDTSFHSSLTAPAVMAMMAGLVLVLALAYGMRTTRPYILFSCAWFILTLIPVLNIFPTSPVVADRYALLPSFGFFFLLASAGIDLSTRIRPRWVAAGMTLLVLTWGGIAIACNRVWYSEETLWKNTIKVSPGSVNAYTNLGRRYFEADHNDDRAFEMFAKAQENNPGDPHLDHFLGLRSYYDRDIPSAIRHFNMAIGKDMEFIETLYQLGIVYEETGEPAKACEYFRLATSSRHMDVGVSLKAAAEGHLRALGGRCGAK